LLSFVLLPSKTTPLGGAILPGGIDERSLIPCRHCLPLHEAGVMFVAPTCCASLWSLLFIVRVALVVFGDRKSIVSWCYPPLLPFPFKMMVHELFHLFSLYFHFKSPDLQVS
jgi:hypothetical protein